MKSKEVLILEAERDMWKASNNAKCEIIFAMEKWDRDDAKRISQLRSALILAKRALETCEMDGYLDPDHEGEYINTYDFDETEVRDALATIGKLEL